MNIYLKRWIESLKSDRFKKYDNGLVDSKEKSFDVLGVACFLGKKENLVRFEVCKETEGLVGYYVDNETDYYCRDVLPPSIRRQLGLSHPNGAFDLTPEIAALKISIPSGETLASAIFCNTISSLPIKIGVP